jgi:hypothetical protein
MGLGLTGPVLLGGGSGTERAPYQGHHAPHAHSGAVGVGSLAASSGQCLRMEHQCGKWETLGKEGAGEVH